MPTIQDIFMVQGLPRNNATCKLWSAGVFSTPPAKNTALPSGSPLQTVTTGTSHGFDGAYRFTNVASGDYYISTEWNGLITWQDRSVSANDGIGYTVATDYPNLQAAINATPSGSTLFIPAGEYPIDRSSTYQWTHPNDGDTRFGLLVNDKRIHIVGEGEDTRIIPAASGMQVLTIFGSTVSGNKPKQSSFRDFVINNPQANAACTGMVIDRAHRVTLNHVSLGERAGLATGLLIKSGIVANLENCYIIGNTINIDASTHYTPDASGGPNHALTIRGGEMQGGGTGLKIKTASMCSIYGTTIEGHSVVGVSASGVNRLWIDGCYWEQASPVNDVEIYDNSRGVRIGNAERIKIRDSGQITINGFRDISTNRIDADTTCHQILVVNPWWSDSAAGNTASRRDILTGVLRGYMKVIEAGEPNANIIPRDTIGLSILQNGEMSGLADGWTFTSMTPVASGLPYGVEYVAATTDSVSGNTCLANIASYPTFNNDWRNQNLTLTCWLKIPDSTWTASLQIVDGDRNRSLPVGDEYKDGTWMPVACTFRLGSAASGITVRVSFTVGVSGQAHCGGAFLHFGGIASDPAVAPHLRPPLQTMRAYEASPITLVVSGDRFDPYVASTLFVSGSVSGNTVMSTAQSLFQYDETVWKDGQRIRLMGGSDTHTITITESPDATTRILLRAPTRTLDRGAVIEFQYSNTLGRWCEVGLGV